MDDLTDRERELLRLFTEMLVYVNSPTDFEKACEYANRRGHELEGDE